MRTLDIKKNLKKHHCFYYDVCNCVYRGVLLNRVLGVLEEWYVMACPYCYKPMTPGFIQARGEVFFTTKKHKLFFSAGKDETILTSDNMTAPTAVAYHCPECKKVIIEYI